MSNVDIQTFKTRNKLAAVLYDSKTETYSVPFYHVTKGDAIRSFSDAVNSSDKSSKLSAHPQDFTVFIIGEFDEVQGSLIAYDIKQPLVNGVDVLEAA